jgi:hypothetical protein
MRRPHLIGGLLRPRKLNRKGRKMIPEFLWIMIVVLEFDGGGIDVITGKTAMVDELRCLAQGQALMNSFKQDEVLMSMLDKMSTLCAPITNTKHL